MQSVILLMIRDLESLGLTHCTVVETIACAVLSNGMKKLGYYNLPI